MKKILLFLAVGFAFANAQGFKPIKKLENIPEDKIQKTIDVSRDSLRKEFWLEVEKNEIVKICIDEPISAWETSLNATIFNDSCIAFQAPMLIGTDSLKAYVPEKNESYTIFLAIGMKYLNFKNTEVLLGFNESLKKNQKTRHRCNVEEIGTIDCSPQENDPKRLMQLTATYLVDKYPVTNCEFLQLMWDSIPQKSSYQYDSKRKIQEEWISRKKTSNHNETCITQDSAANTVSLYQALKYANARSMHENLKPYYLFSKTNESRERIISEKQFVIGYWDFTEHKDKFFNVSVNQSSDGYRLPYYDEWMIFARGGDKKKKAPWSDSATFEEASKYAKFNTTYPNSEKEMYNSEPVGQLQPNGYGLYDIFGLVEEHVLLKKDLNGNRGLPSCRKGGEYYVSLDDEIGYPNWREFNYGHFHIGQSGAEAGFRLIRNIGNNAKWENIESGSK